MENTVLNSITKMKKKLHSEKQALFYIRSIDGIIYLNLQKLLVSTLSQSMTKASHKTK